MKSLLALLAALIIGSGYTLISDNLDTHTASPLQFQADEPGKGNDGEDTTDRSLACRLFNIFC